MGLFDGFGGERSNNRRTNNGEMSDIEASLTTLSSVAVKESETNKNAQKSHHHLSGTCHKFGGPKKTKIRNQNLIWPVVNNFSGDGDGDGIHTAAVKKWAMRSQCYVDHVMGCETKHALDSRFVQMNLRLTLLLLGTHHFTIS